MNTDVLNAADYGVLPGSGPGERNSAALQRALDDLGALGGGTLLIAAWEYEFAERISVAVSTEANCSGTLRITGDSMPALVAPDDNTVFVVTEAKNAQVGHVIFEGLQFQGNLEAPTS
ncbi:MAG: hypothetical protein ABSD52_05490 [Candidatus Cybelea sp.]|jgi:hypothetical protein